MQIFYFIIIIEAGKSTLRTWGINCPENQSRPISKWSDIIHYAATKVYVTPENCLNPSIMQRVVVTGTNVGKQITTLQIRRINFSNWKAHAIVYVIF